MSAPAAPPKIGSVTAGGVETTSEGQAHSSHHGSRFAMIGNRYQDFLIAIAVLSLVEILVFGTAMSRTDFFVDDWLILSSLAFGPQDFVGMIRGQLADPTQLIRPLESPYFAILFKLFGCHAAPYHYLNASMEVMTAFCLFGAVKKLSKNSALALAAAGLFVVNPTHDATHYWMLCSSATLSMMLFIASFWAMLEGIDRDSSFCKIAAAATMALSAFNYECCIMLPLLIGPAVAILLSGRDDSASPLRASLWKAANATLFLSVPSLAAVAYQRVLTPLLGPTWLRSVSLDPTMLGYSILQGLQIQVPSTPIAALLGNGVHLTQICQQDALAVPKVIVGCLVFGLALSFLLRSQPNAKQNLMPMIALGFLFATVSLVVYGLNPEYAPLLLTPINRVNLGASVGGSIVIAAITFAIRRPLIRFISQFPWGQFRSGKFAHVLIVGILTGLLALFSLADIVLSRPWMASTIVQRRVFEIARRHASVFRDRDGVLLLNCPRYCLWAPVFDGTWDFEAMMQVATGKSLHGTVLSDYLVVEPGCLVDRRNGREVAKLPFDSLYGLVPQSGLVLPIPSSMALRHLAERDDTQFGVSKSVARQWYP
jgi:hypothetical protein